MIIKCSKIKYHRHKTLLPATVLIIAILSSCASPNKRRHQESITGQPSRAESGELFGPVSDSTVEPFPPASAPLEIISKPDRIVLVFGRGLAQGYTYVGVLRALSELKIPIHAIYATEIGALAAALYFTQPNSNRVDWALLRFTEKNLLHPEGNFSFVRLQSPESELSERLRDIFGERRVESLSEKLHITLEDSKTGENLEAKSGTLWRALRGALAGANGFSPEDFEGRKVRASSRKILAEYQIARQTEKYPVVVVNAGFEPPELFRKLVESQKAVFITIPMLGINDLDLGKKNQAVFLGKNAIHQAANELLGLIGRKRDGKEIHE